MLNKKNTGNLPAIRHHQPARVFRCFDINIHSFLAKVKSIMKKAKLPPLFRQYPARGTGFR